MVTITTTKTIEITVDTNGQTQVETKGFQGSGCRQASAFLEQALGRPTNERLTPEFHFVTIPHQQQTRQS